MSLPDSEEEVEGERLKRDRILGMGDEYSCNYRMDLKRFIKEVEALDSRPIHAWRCDFQTLKFCGENQVS